MAVHLIKGKGYACGIEKSKRWESSQISGTRGMKKVTCKSCLKAVKKVVK